MKSQRVLVSLSIGDMKSIVGAYFAHEIERGMSDEDVRARRNVMEALESCSLNPESQPCEEAHLKDSLYIQAK